jgi:hypothetical protein
MKAAIAMVLLSALAHADLTVNTTERLNAQNDACPRERTRDICCHGRHCDVSRSFMDRTLTNLLPVVGCARIVPSIVDGRPLGFKLYAIRPGSVFARLLLQNGDRIETINGMDLTSPDHALEVYTRLRSAGHFVVAVERRGEALNLDYTIR